MKSNRRSVEKEAPWRGHVQRQSCSGLSIRGYCREQELSEASFYLWRRELQVRDLDRPPLELATDPVNGSPAAKHSGLVSVDVVGLSSPQTIDVVLASGVVIRVREDVESAALERVLKVVDGIALSNSRDNGGALC